jgi:hypothetical protein
VTDILSPVERKCGHPFWVFVREFRNNAGFNAARTADALAVGLYSSHGSVAGRARNDSDRAKRGVESSLKFLRQYMPNLDLIIQGKR